MGTNNIKKEVTHDWSGEFSNLSVYSQNKLYRIIGAFVIGIEMLNFPRAGEYRPVFVCYPLWRSDIKKCFDEPIFTQEIRSKKGALLNIPYIKHSIVFQEAVACTKEQAWILSQSDISLQQLLEVFDGQFSQVLIRASPTGKASVLEAKLFAALYMNDMVAVKKVLEEAYRSSETWPPELFEWKYGKTEVWIKGLQEAISNRDEFLKQIAINMQDKKIAKLHSSEITL